MGRLAGSRATIAPGGLKTPNNGEIEAEGILRIGRGTAGRSRIAGGCL